MKYFLLIASLFVYHYAFADARIVFGDNADDPTGPMIHIPVGSYDDPDNADIEFKLNDNSITRFDVQAGSSLAIVVIRLKADNSHLPYELVRQEEGSERQSRLRKTQDDFDDPTCTLKLDGDTYTSESWYIDWRIRARHGNWGATVTAKMVCTDLAKS